MVARVGAAGCRAAPHGALWAGLARSLWRRSARSGYGDAMRVAVQGLVVHVVRAARCALSLTLRRAAGNAGARPRPGLSTTVPLTRGTVRSALQRQRAQRTLAAAR